MKSINPECFTCTCLASACPGHDAHTRETPWLSSTIRIKAVSDRAGNRGTQTKATKAASRVSRGGGRVRTTRTTAIARKVTKGEGGNRVVRTSKVRVSREISKVTDRARADVTDRSRTDRSVFELGDRATHWRQYNAGT